MRPTRRRPAASRKIRAAAREDGSYDPAPAEHQDPAQGHQGRLASVRAELLPPLPAGGAARRAGRYLDQPSRIPLRRAEQPMTAEPPSAFARMPDLAGRRAVRGAAGARGLLVRMVGGGPSPLLGRHFRSHPRADDVPLLPAADDGAARGASGRHPGCAARPQIVLLVGVVEQGMYPRAGCAKVSPPSRASCCSASAWT